MNCENLICVCLKQTKTKFEIETEKNELARLLEKRTREVENLTGKMFETQTHTVVERGTIKTHVV